MINIGQFMFADNILPSLSWFNQGWLTGGRHSYLYLHIYIYISHIYIQTHTFIFISSTFKFILTHLYLYLAHLYSYLTNTFIFISCTFILILTHFLPCIFICILIYTTWYSRAVQTIYYRIICKVQV
jgi:hypothetical protein